MHKPDEETLSALLAKYQEQRCTPAEIEILHKWYEGFTAFDMLTFTSDEEKADIKALLRERIAASTGMRIPVSPTNRRYGLMSRPIIRWMTAASLLFMLTLTWYFLSRERNQLIYVDVPKGGQQLLVKLPDQSQIWLSPGSTVRYASSFGTDNRTISLEGMAFFDVVADASSPFIINTPADIQVRVLGTAFSVQAYDAMPTVAITVINGKVKVSSGQADTSLLGAGQQLAYHKKKRSLYCNRCRYSGHKKAGNWGIPA
ncbi:FecR domain-containing protein [Chitinophaga pendula]|uniref:FecR family protein n=1 Tax=Chitinophaga pendula TaxID=2849666 RepID=UPI001CEC0F7E|nr:FecR domain-containing protein [Chitinophaga pendula]UCJ06842.1 FecR domain-containing protein [Chitinophaga pendula]